MMADKDGCTCFDETTRQCPICRLYFTKKKGYSQRIKPKRRSEQLKCKHKWREAVYPKAGWRNICKKCGVHAQ